MTGAERPGPAEPVSPSGRDDPDERRPFDYGDDDDDGDDDEECCRVFSCSRGC